MARIFPFRALRYDPARVLMDQVVTQPYDKITPEMQERYYAAHAYNLVRIILGKRQPGDDHSHNVYTRAAACFREWRRDRILVPDAEPSLYAYWQQFAVTGSSGQQRERRAFIALGQLEPYSAGVVFRHEQTLSAPKADRLNLLLATRAHFGQIFMLYRDPAGEVEALLTPEREPEIDVRDEYQVRHRVWRISDPALIGAVGARMADKKLIIADGHHRYETALNYQAERRAAAGAAGSPAADAPWDRVIMTLVNMDSAGLVILPTHRILSGLLGFRVESFIEAAGQYFVVERLDRALDSTRATALLAEAGRERTALLAVTAGGNHLLRVRPGAADTLLAGVSPRQRGLDVVLLHTLLLGHVLGLSEETIREQKHISYLRDAAEAMARVRAGADIAFLMNPVRIQQVRDTAFAGEVLPQKSTDFYPKLLSGLTIYALE